jgi:hypothetical protein
MRRLGLAAIWIAVLAATAQAGNSAKTATELWQMPPRAIAEFAGADDGDWVAKTVYSAVPMGGGVSAIVLFARPVENAGICTVAMVSISFATDEQGMARDLAAYRVSGTSRSSGFAVADGDCAHTTIRTDFMKRSGADNVFAASSPADASHGADRFAGALALIRDTGKPLRFALSCESAPKDLCRYPREMLAKLKATDFEETGVCGGDDCAFVQGFDGHFDWRLEMMRGRAVLKLTLEPVF